MQMKCLKIGLHHTEFCSHQVRGAQIVQTFSQRVKPQTGKFVVLEDEPLHIEYLHYLQKLCMSSIRLVDIHSFYGLR